MYERQGKRSSEWDQRTAALYVYMVGLPGSPPPVSADALLSPLFFLTTVDTPGLGERRTHEMSVTLGDTETLDSLEILFSNGINS